MGKIVYLMGKSSSGKDTIFKELMKEGTMDLRTIVPYTTRPIRAYMLCVFSPPAGRWSSISMTPSTESGGILQWMTDRSIWQNRTIS